METILFISWSGKKLKKRHAAYICNLIWDSFLNLLFFNTTSLVVKENLRTLSLTLHCWWYLAKSRLAASVVAFVFVKLALIVLSVVKFLFIVLVTFIILIASYPVFLAFPISLPRVILLLALMGFATTFFLLSLIHSFCLDCLLYQPLSSPSMGGSGFSLSLKIVENS